MLKDEPLFEALSRRAEALRAAQPSWEVRLTYSPGTRAKRSASLQVIAAERAGQLALWETGECDVEAIDQDGVQLFWNTRVVSTPAELDEPMDQLLAALRQTKAGPDAR